MLLSPYSDYWKWSHYSCACKRSQWLLPQEPYLYFPTAAAVSAPAGAFVCMFPLTKQWLLPQEPLSLFSTAATVPASAEAYIFTSHCRSSAHFRRSRFLFPDAAAGSASTEASFPFRCRSSARFRRSLFLISDAATTILLQVMSSTPLALSSASLGVINAQLWLLSCTNRIFGGSVLGPG